MKVLMWTKDNCFYCENAKQLLNKLDIKYEERNISSEWTKEQMLKMVPEAKTVPQIIINGTLIGGYTDLVQFIKNEKLT